MINNQQLIKVLRIHKEVELKKAVLHSESPTSKSRACRNSFYHKQSLESKNKLIKLEVITSN